MARNPSQGTGACLYLLNSSRIYLFFFNFFVNIHIRKYRRLNFILRAFKYAFGSSVDFRSKLWNGLPITQGDKKITCSVMYVF